MIYTLGESLLDIIFTNLNEIVAKPGGGMLNSAVSLARSDCEVSLISELGDDKSTQMIIDFLYNNKVNSKYIKKYFRQKTSVALAFLNEQKVPSFSIHKSYPKKRRLIFPSEFTPDDILVYGSLYSLDPIIRNDIVSILASAKQGGALLCYDPNIRHHNLNEPEIRKALEENMSFANIVKGSDEDFRNIFGDGSASDYYLKLKKYNADAVFVYTQGAKGVTGFSGDNRIDLKAHKIKVISTIGAGDAFNAGIVFYLSKIKDGDRITKVLDNNTFNGMLKSGLRYSAAVCETMDNYVPINFS